MDCTLGEPARVYGRDPMPRIWEDLGGFGDDLDDLSIWGRTKLTHYNHYFKVTFTPIVTCLNVLFLPQKNHFKDFLSSRFLFYLPKRMRSTCLIKSYEFSFP